MNALKSVNMILIMYVLSCNFSKLTILYIHVHNHFMTNKSVMTFLYVNEIYVCLVPIKKALNISL